MAPRILLVDDDISQRKMFASLLRNHGYAVLDAGNGRKAMEHLEREPVDLLITDMVMPEMDGVQTILAVRNRCPGVKIIAVAERKLTPAESSLNIARILGSQKHFVKPLVPDELLDAVRELVG